MLVTMDQTWETNVKTTTFLVVSGDLPFKLDITVNCTNSKMSKHEYPCIKEVKNFLLKAFHLRHGLRVLK